jgi:phosphotransferase system HPr (HPr) family protein
MVERTFNMNRKEGLHARPAALFTRIASAFRSDVFIIKDGERGNAKSLLSILALGIFEGDAFTVQAQGPDEREALDRIAHLIETDFSDLLRQP